MCGTSFGDVKPPKSIQKAETSPRATVPAAQPAAQPKPAPAKTAASNAPKPAAKTAATPATKPAYSQGASKPPTAATLAAAATAKAAAENVNAPIKNAGSIKKPRPLYASKPRFGLGSLVGLIFVAAFAIAAIVFGLNTLSGNTPASAPAQPAFTLDVTATTLPAVIETVEITETSGAVEATPTIAATEAPAEAPIEVPAVVNTEAPAATAEVVATAEVAATVTAAPTIAPSPTTAAQPSATPPPPATATVAPSPTPAPTAVSGELGAGETLSYTVKGGDTCGKIAKQFNISVAQIIQWNNLDDRCFLSVNKVLTVKK
jgi:LysM repeat protein